jgi:hypothetical protein
LFSVDVRTGQVGEKVFRNVRYFAMADGKQTIFITANAVAIPHLHFEEQLTAEEMITCQPLILKDFAVVIGIQGGTVRMYDLSNPAIKRDWRPSGLKGEITAMVPYKDLIIVGDSSGGVALGKLKAPK